MNSEKGMIYPIFGFIAILLVGAFVYIVLLRGWNMVYTGIYTDLNLTATGTSSFAALDGLWQGFSAVLLLAGMLWFFKTILHRREGYGP